MSGYSLKGQLIVLHPRTGTHPAGIGAASGNTHATDHASGHGAHPTAHHPRNCDMASHPTPQHSMRPSSPLKTAEIIPGPGYTNPGGDNCIEDIGRGESQTATELETPTQKPLTYQDLFGGTEIADEIVRTHQDVLMQTERLKK